MKRKKYIFAFLMLVTEHAWVDPPHMCYETFWTVWLDPTMLHLKVDEFWLQPLVRYPVVPSLFNKYTLPKFFYDVLLRFMNGRNWSSQSSVNYLLHQYCKHASISQNMILYRLQILCCLFLIDGWLHISGWSILEFGIVLVVKVQV